MRILLLVGCVLLLVLSGIQARAQHDSLLKKQANRLINHELAESGLVADSLSRKGEYLEIYFNKDRQFSKGEIGESLAESLTESMIHLLAETGASHLLLLARDKVTGEWKTIDYFTDMPAVVRYVLPPNKDPYPAIAGSQTGSHFRVFPGGAQPVLGGALSGKTVWLSPGHGWHNTGSGFVTQRGTTQQVVEDFITAESMDYYLLHYLMNAGATVWSVRERDLNTNEIIVNNDQGAPGYVETGTWVDGTIAGYGGTYRTTSASATETATAIFTPAVSQSGLYWVSVRFISGVNRATDVKYHITHAGGTTTYTVNQEIHGDTWIHLGQFYFFAGGSYKVIISNESAEAGQAIVADAIRLGGGIGQEPDCLNGGAASGKPRFEESARQYANYQGYPTCFADPNMRPIYSEWEMSKGAAAEAQNSIFVSFHTNAFDGGVTNVVGTETYRYDGLGAGRPNITAGSTELRDLVHNQVINDIRAGYSATWNNRGVKAANFAELRLLDVMPGILLELAFHDAVTDANALKTPEFRRLASRAIYKGIVRFFSNRDGIPLVYLPEEPVQVMAKNIGSSRIEVSWAAPVSGGIYGDPATGYRLYISENGKGFDNGITVAGTSYVFTGTADKTYFFKVTATNAGGESFASSVVAAHTPAAGDAVKYLIVDGFDRLDASAMLLKYEGPLLGNVRRMFLEKMNSYDYMVEHGNGLASCNLAFDGAQNEVVASGLVSLPDYYAVDWFVGEESTAHLTLDNNEKQKVKEYLDGGGRLLISGSEIAWDLGRAASPNADLSFFNDYLKAVYVGDGAGTYDFTGTPSLFTGQHGTFSNGFDGYYNVDFPDRLSPSGGSEIVLNYVGGTADGAGIGYKGNYNLLYFGFPIEAIIDDNVRNSLICQSAAYLATPLIPLPVAGFVLGGRPDGTVNRLSWETYSEINTVHFIIERSANGIGYTPLGNPVPAQGLNGQGHAYRFTDEQVLPAAYYRVKAVDADGSEMISNIVLLKNGSQRQLYIVQNPVHESLRIRVSRSGKLSVILTNALGQTVYTSASPVGAGQELSIPVSKLAKGIYWLTAYTEGYQKETYKIVIQ